MGIESLLWLISNVHISLIFLLFLIGQIGLIFSVVSSVRYEKSVMMWTSAVQCILLSLTVGSICVFM